MQFSTQIPIYQFHCQKIHTVINDSLEILLNKILISITHFDLLIFRIEIIINREKVQICDAFSSLGIK